MYIGHSTFFTYKCDSNFNDKENIIKNQFNSNYYLDPNWAKDDLDVKVNEIHKNELLIFCKEYDFNELVNYFSNLGFNSTSLDLEGLISGKLNR